jgi:ubiquinone/menaquinone biosynthesis C-methylase UbiE
MIKTILRFIKKNPRLYNLTEIIYNFFRVIKFTIWGSKSDENYWARRHNNKKHRKKDDWGGEDTDWINSYRNSTEHPHRKLLIEKISGVKPVSILEVGCNCGPNLFLLAKIFPMAELTGVDINSMAVQKGNEWFEQEGIKNIKLIACKAEELEQFSDNAFDVVFTDALLIYFGPDKIKKVIKEMIRVSGKELILLEWNDFANEKNSLGKYDKHWVRNYKSLLKGFVSEENIITEKIPEDLWPDNNWQKYGAVIEVKK